MNIIIALRALEFTKLGIAADAAALHTELDKAINELQAIVHLNQGLEYTLVPVKTAE